MKSFKVEYLLHDTWCHYGWHKNLDWAVIACQVKCASEKCIGRVLQNGEIVYEYPEQE